MKLAKRLKKEKVTVDIVNFGEVVSACVNYMVEKDVCSQYRLYNTVSRIKPVVAAIVWSCIHVCVTLQYTLEKCDTDSNTCACVPLTGG